MFPEDPGFNSTEISLDEVSKDLSKLNTKHLYAFFNKPSCVFILITAVNLSQGQIIKSWHISMHCHLKG